jgi:hypothetical protein
LDYKFVLLESRVQLHSTFRELFPLSTNHQIAPGVNGQGFNEKMDKRLEELKQAYLSVSAKVRTLEINMTEFSKKMAECEMSCQGFSILFELNLMYRLATY